MVDKSPRIALLIDADNSPAAKIGVILDELSTFGETSIRRAYGNWKKQELRGWEEILHEHAIRPMQQFDYSKGKNASDMAMVIDALDLLYSDRPEAFGIVSSDADFTPLVMYLRAKGARSTASGARRHPSPSSTRARASSTRQAGDARFSAPVDIDTGEAARDDGSATPLRMPTAKLRRRRQARRPAGNAVEAAKGENGWARVGAVGQQIGNQASFDPRNYGYATLTKLLKATDLFQLEKEGTSEVAVRDMRQASRPSA